MYNKEYVKKIIGFIKTNYSDKINKIVVFGDSVNPEIKNPESLDIAIECIDAADHKNYEMLGDILSYMGEIVDNGDCTLTPIDKTIVKQQYIDLINKGKVVYRKG